VTPPPIADPHSPQGPSSKPPFLGLKIFVAVDVVSFAATNPFKLAREVRAGWSRPIRRVRKVRTPQGRTVANGDPRRVNPSEARATETNRFKAVSHWLLAVSKIRVCPKLAAR